MSLQMTEGHTELSFQYARVNGQEETLLEFLLRRFRYYGSKEWGRSHQIRPLVSGWSAREGVEKATKQPTGGLSTS